MIGIIPAAGAGQRIQPLGCSKELLPVGSRSVEGADRPKAVSEYLVERMIEAGAEEICMIISPEKTDLIRYFSEREYSAGIFYAVQPNPIGLCDALFRAEAFASRHSQVLIGLPDTIWFPENGYRSSLASLTTHHADADLLLFPVLNPQFFDSVVCDENNYVRRVDVKNETPETHWVWGAVTTTGDAFHALRLLWEARHREDEYLGHLLNAFIAAGNAVRGSYSGEIYIDVGTMDGYRGALDFLRKKGQIQNATPAETESKNAA